MWFAPRCGLGLNALLGVIRRATRNNDCVCCVNSMLLSGESLVELAQEHCSGAEQHPKRNSNSGSERRYASSLTTKGNRRHYRGSDAKSRWQATIVPSKVFQCEAD